MDQGCRGRPQGTCRLRAGRSHYFFVVVKINGPFVLKMISWFDFSEDIPPSLTLKYLPDTVGRLSWVGALPPSCSSHPLGCLRPQASYPG